MTHSDSANSESADDESFLATELFEAFRSRLFRFASEESDCFLSEVPPEVRNEHAIEELLSKPMQGRAFIFTFLTVLFISMVATHHGDDHGHDEHDPYSDEDNMDLDKLIDPSRITPMSSPS